MTRHHPDREARRRRRVVLVTDAQRSQDEQLRTRQIRYATMMGIRVVCLIVAGILVSVRAPMLWLWIPLCLIGMVALPWMAVLIANDRLPREPSRLTRFLRGRDGTDHADRQLDTHARDELGAAPPEAGRRSLPPPQPRVIDHD